MKFLEYFMQNSKPSLLFDTAKNDRERIAGIRELHYSSQLCKRLVEIVDDENSLASIRDFALTVVLRCSDSSQRNVRNFFLGRRVSNRYQINSVEARNGMRVREFCLDQR